MLQLPEGLAHLRIVQGSNDVTMKTVGAIAAAQIALMPLAGAQHISKLCGIVYGCMRHCCQMQLHVNLIVFRHKAA